MRTWTLRHWSVATGVTLLAAIAIGVPTGVVPTPFYTRMTPVLWWNYPVWAVSSVLEGLLVASFVRSAPSRPARRAEPRSTRALFAGILSAFAVGCPVCNKLVVLALGVSGAMSFWAPAQPVLAVASLALLAHALVRRLRTAQTCPVPAGAQSARWDALDDWARGPGRPDVRGEGSDRATAG